MRKTTLFLQSLLIAAVLGGPAFAQLEEFFDDFSTANLPGRLFVPDEAADSARPAILFLHGAGEVGSNNLSQINGNINNLFREARNRGAFIYAPQAVTFGWDGLARTDLVMTMIDQLLANENVDPNRLYVTGLSMGGGGAWNMASRYSDNFAATVPIAGVSPAGDFDPDVMTDMSSWAFHARNDSVVNKITTRRAVGRILLAAGQEAPEFPPDSDQTTTLEFVSEDPDLRYTEWPTGGHGIWSRVYSTPEMYDWMFAKSVPEPAAFALLAMALSGFVVLRRSSTAKRSRT